MRDTSEDLKCCGLHEQGTENYDVRCENCQLRCRGKGGCNALKPLGQFTLQHRRDRRDGSQGCAKPPLLSLGLWKPICKTCAKAAEAEAQKLASGDAQAGSENLGEQPPGAPDNLQIRAVLQKLEVVRAEMQQKATKAELQHVYSSLQVQQQEAKADVQHLQVEQKETRAEVQHVYRSLAKSIEVVNDKANMAAEGHKQLQQISAEQSRQMQAMAADQRQRSRDAAENLGPFTLIEAARDASPDGSDDMICYLQQNGRLEIKDGKQNFTSLMAQIPLKLGIQETGKTKEGRSLYVGLHKPTVISYMRRLFTWPAV